MARPRTAAAVTRRAPAPRHPRRVSGPVARPRVVPGRPRPTTPVSVPTSTFADRVRTLPDARFLDRILRSRAWIWMLGIALGGIVTMQVSLLGMNSGISRSVQASTDLQRDNALLQKEIATLQGGERVNMAAASAGLATPDAGDVGVLKVRKRVDAERASVTPPSETARANLAAGGVSATAVTEPVATVAPETTTTTVAATPTPVATATPTAIATATPVATVDPATTTTTAVTP